MSKYNKKKIKFYRFVENTNGSKKAKIILNDYNLFFCQIESSIRETYVSHHAYPPEFVVVDESPHLMRFSISNSTEDCDEGTMRLIMEELNAMAVANSTDETEINNYIVYDFKLL